MSEADVNELMTQAQKQLAEHAEWLAVEIEKMPTNVDMAAGKALLCAQAQQIKLRMVRSDKGIASVVWEYPDELGAFLRSTGAPQHLRDTLTGGHIVSTEQPAFTAVRTND